MLGTSYETTAPTITSNRACSTTITECTAQQHQTAPPTLTSDRLCGPGPACTAGANYSHINATLTANAVCKPCGGCDLAGVTVISGCTPFHNTVCNTTNAHRSSAGSSAGSERLSAGADVGIGIAVLLVLEDADTKAPLVVGNAHLTWDPEFKDVKVIQTVMLMEEMGKFMDAELGDEAAKVPIILGGDFNSTPDSGVFEFITKGKISQSHDDLIGKDYKGFADKVVRVSCRELCSPSTLSLGPVLAQKADPLSRLRACVLCCLFLALWLVFPSLRRGG